MSAGRIRVCFSALPVTGSWPAILVDRDGIINERIVGGYVTDWTQFRFVPGIESALATLSELPFPIIVVSNQPGVGKGLLQCSTLSDITARFVAELHRAGARIDAVYYCPHTQEQKCTCRKPAVGLLTQAAADWRLELSRSVLIGDAITDIQAARSAGSRAVLLDPGVLPLPTRTLLMEAGAIHVTRVADIVPAVYSLLDERGAIAQ